MRSMNTLNTFCFRVRRVVAAFMVAAAVAATVILTNQVLVAAPWKNLEPLKSRRPDVEQTLGKPINEQPNENGALNFKVETGMVKVAFVTSKFVQTKKLSPELEGTVLQVVFQHENSQETPESLGLLNNTGFAREDAPGGTVFRNQKDGIVHTFIDGKLRTTWYSPSAEQLARAQKGA